MGILDDAIREHLELKRKHGAAEEELRQQEVEALGAPVDAQSEDAADLADGNGGQTAPEEALEAEAPPEPELDEAEPLEPEPPEPEPELVEQEPVEPEPVEPQPAEPFEVEAAEPDFHELDPDEPEATFPAGEDEEPPPGGDTPARGFAPVEEEPHEDDAPAEGDVLEDTPDFLQETPEHDRLWFEQKPPRDFDFD